MPQPESQRDGMGLLDYQAMLSLHDGWRLVVYIYYMTAGGNSISSELGGKLVHYGKGRWYGPSITYKITPAGPLSSS